MLMSLHTCDYIVYYVDSLVVIINEELLKYCTIFQMPTT